jgi:hypothetical protein
VSRARTLFVVLFAVTVTLLAGVFGVACGTTDTGETIQPITGVTVRAETLTAGRGCGTGSTQIFRYAVVVYARAEYVAGNVYDCFADGTFVELPDIGTDQYTLEVFAYSQTAYVAAGGDAVVKLVGRLNDNHALLLTDAGAAALTKAAAAIEGDLKLLRSSNPTYSTTCTAAQLGLVQTLALCKPLQLGAGGIGQPTPPASVVLGLSTFTTNDGGTVTCDDQYVTVRSRLRVGNVEGASTDTHCSALGDAGLEAVTITINPAEAPASYLFSLTLLRADGTTLGTTTCGADTSPGLPSPAHCQPLQ